MASRTPRALQRDPPRDTFEPARLARPSGPRLAPLVGERLDGSGRRLEVAGLESGDDLTGELQGLAFLIGVENRVHGGGYSSFEYELDVHRVELASRDVRVHGNTDPDDRVAAIGKPCSLLDRVRAQAHKPRIPVAAQGQTSDARAIIGWR